MRTRNDILHPGEREAQERFGGAALWDDGALDAMMRRALDARMIDFIEAQPFFFLATADADGNCDASFRGREHDAGGRPLPVAKVLEGGRQLVFPDFAGNHLYSSLGNILANPKVGLLFIDFERQRRLRVNGAAVIVPAATDIVVRWPTAQRAVVVTVEQAFPNCRARIPRLTMPAAQGDA